MEPKGSLPYSQVPTTCPCAQSDRSRPCHTSHFLKIHFNTILPSKPGSSKWHHSLRFSHQNPVHTSTLLHTCYITHLFILLDLITRTILGEGCSSLCSSLNVNDQVSHQHKTRDKIIVLFILSLHFWIAKWKTKDSVLNDSKHSLTSICS